MRHFIWNDEPSTLYHVIVVDPPDIVIGAMRAETQKVIGSSRLLHYTEGPMAMDSVMVTLNCAMLKSTYSSDLYKWLRGAGNLTIPGDCDHYYRAFVKNQISLSKILRQRETRRFSLQFECEPFRYHMPYKNSETPGSMFGTYGNPKRIGNGGTAPCEPLIRVEGSGAGALTVGSTVFTFDSINEYVMLDCEAQIAYKGETNMGTHVTRQGDWPIVPPGGLTVSWSGGITGVKYAPRARDY